MICLSQLREAGSPLRLLLPAALVFVGQVLGLLWGAHTLRQAEAQLAAKQRNLAALEHSQPAPTQTVAAALAADSAAASAALAEAEAPWRDNAITRALSPQADASRESAPPLLPLNRRAAYFDLARYRQSMTRLAQEHGVALGHDPQFGFGDYANEAPEEADVLSVYKQRLVLEQVVSALLRSRPQRLLAVIRGGASAEFSAASAAIRDEANAEPALLRDVVSRDRFQIRFRGQTAVLRDWLNALAAMSLPVAVCSIDVEPSAVAGGRQVVSSSARPNWAASPARVDEVAADGFELLVRPMESDFVVTLEYVELLDEPSAIALAEANEGERDTVDVAASPPSKSLDAGPAVSRWPAPQPQPRGAQWVYEVFTPPEIFYHAASQQFRVKPVPASTAPAIGNVAPLAGPNQNRAPRLLAVNPEEYPLQLVGYLGDQSNEEFLGIFENRQSGETLLLSAGAWLEPLGIQVLRLYVERSPEETAATEGPGQTLRPLRAAAEIRDTLGELRTLREGERATGSGLVAQLELDGEVRELREGATLENTDGLSLQIEKIEAAPAPRIFLKYHRSDDAPAELLWLELDSPQ